MLYIKLVSLLYNFLEVWQVTGKIQTYISTSPASKNTWISEVDPHTHTHTHTYHLIRNNSCHNMSTHVPRNHTAILCSTHFNTHTFCYHTHTNKHTHTEICINRTLTGTELCLGVLNRTWTQHLHTSRNTRKNKHEK